MKTKLNESKQDVQTTYQDSWLKSKMPDLDALWLGFKDSLPIAPSVAAYASLAGLLSAKHGIDLVSTIGFDLVMFAGGAQIIVADMWKPGLSIGEVLIAVFIVNFRYCLIGASLQEVFRGSTFRESLAKMHLVADENWAITVGKIKETTKSLKPNAYFRDHLFGGGICILLFWLIATTLGHELGSFIEDPKKLGLDFAFASVFTAMAVKMYRHRIDLMPWFVALVASCASYVFLPGQKWYIAIGGILGAVSHLVLHKESKTDES